MSPIDRRTFLKLGGAGILGVAFTPLLTGCDGGTVEPPYTNAGFAPFITPTSQFYVQHGGRDTIAGWTMPDLDRSAQITIRGVVDAPMTITVDDIERAAAAGQKRTIFKTMRCVIDSHLRPGATGWTGNAVFTGVPLRYFLEQAEIDWAAAARINITGYDGFLNNISLERLGRTDQGEMEPLLVYQMNGEPLTREHGAPVRLIMLETYGYKNLKWLKDINVSIHDRVAGTYQREGFADDGVIRVTSRGENVSENVTLPSGLVEITGHALSGEGRITAVEISIDDAPYVPVELEPNDRIYGSLPLPTGILQQRENYPFRGVWTKWRYRWNAPSGAHSIAIRAKDSSGSVQPEIDTEITNGQSGIVRYLVTVS